MSIVTKQLILSTVRIIAYTKKGTATGTGFVYLHKRNGKSRYFVVTNKHVIKDAIRGEMIFHEGELINGKMTPKLRCGLSVPFNEHDFWGNSNNLIDIAVMNISTIVNVNLENFYLMAITEKVRPKDEKKDKLISPIEEVLFIGYPIGIWDTKNYLPIVRKGITATPYYINFENEKKYLIDAAVFPGSSGSPVFIYRSGTHLDNSGDMQIGEQLYFIGIISEYLKVTKKGKIIKEEIPSSLESYVEIDQALNLGIVFNDAAVVETMDDIVDRILDPIEQAMKQNIIKQ